MVDLFKNWVNLLSFLTEFFDFVNGLLKIVFYKMVGKFNKCEVISKVSDWFQVEKVISLDLLGKIFGKFVFKCNYQDL